ncbi:MAG: helix-turn-helix domain-containing protein [Chloroflexi bacterium]|nr:helix-turn-helix domain-containing protein [Chloroflexota bacterium]
MKPRYRVTLTMEERRELKAMTRTVKTDARRFVRARALLLCDRGEYGPAWNVDDTAEALGVERSMTERLKKRFVEEGLSAALGRRQRVRPPRLDLSGSQKSMFDGFRISHPPQSEKGSRQ